VTCLQFCAEVLVVIGLWLSKVEVNQNFIDIITHILDVNLNFDTVDR